MTTSLDKILSYSAIDLHPFEIRGAKAGFNNARTTGPVYVNGQYVPAYDNITGNGSFTADSSIVTGLVFDSPYGAFTTEDLKIRDGLTANSNSFTIKSILSANSVALDGTFNASGYYSIAYRLVDRDYLVEPDVYNNTIQGNAVFNQGDTTVIGIDTSWMGALDAKDFIKHDGFQEYFKIKGVLNDTTLGLVSAYTGDTTTGPYTAKKWYIGRTRIQYNKNNFAYDNKSGKWTYDATIGSDISTSTIYQPLVDGITTAFTHSLDSNAPDLMDVKAKDYLTLSRETQYDTFQFSLPVVPHAETLRLYINDIEKDQYPSGNKDYVLSYSQNPVYAPPPPPDQRFVANVMFMRGITDVSPVPSLTETGQIRITDQMGKDVTDIMPGSESVKIDNTSIAPFRDYILEPSSGTLEIIEPVIDEQIVKYVGIDIKSYIDYGFTVTKNGVKQKISFPAEPDDDIIFQPDFGRFKPKDKDHPGLDEIYDIRYMVETDLVSDEIITGVSGQTVIEVDKFPVKQGSVFLLKNGIIIDEYTDFFVSYLSGRIVLAVPLTGTDVITVSYTPLSKHINGMSYSDGAWYCTSYDSRLVIYNADKFEFTLTNYSLDTATISIQRIYNETKSMDYDLTGIVVSGRIIRLLNNSTNTTIGLSATDVVVIDYKFESETTEYYPVVINYLNVNEGVSNLYIEGSDITPLIDASSIVNLIQPDGAVGYFFTVDSSTFDGYGTVIGLDSSTSDEMVNPGLYITDSSMNYLTVPLAAEALTSGSTLFSFPGANIRNIFRPGTILRVNKDVYQVSDAIYNSNLRVNSVTINSEILHDTTDSTSLTSIYYSDCPVYLEGGTEIIPLMPIITTVNQPAFILNNYNDHIITVTADSTQLQIKDTTFAYTDYATLGDLSSAIASADIEALSLTTYVPLWKSDKIIPVSGLSVYTDSSTVLYASPALRYHGADASIFLDSTNFTVDPAGTISLNSPLVKKDRYKLDYMGREFLGDSSVTYSAQYFVNLPAKSKVNASFEYDNIDQFYIQVLSQRSFFEIVTLPRMTEESYQLNDNPGQGGDIPGDTISGPSEGGLTGDEFKRQDADIECRVFKNIYDFFHDRLKAYGDEMDAAIGYRLFNNDGLFTDAQQDAAAKVVNRIFPDPDYTNLEPMRVNPLTGYFFAEGTVFTNNQTSVSNVSGDSQWLTQLKTSDYIGRPDSTKRYEIASVDSNSTLTLLTPFIESSTADLDEGESYTAATSYPIYDDDGNVGYKIIGTKYKNFNLSDGDIFDCYIDGVYQSYTFQDPPVGPPVLPLLLYLIYLVKRMTADDVCKILTSNMTGLNCTVERVLDSNKAYGYRTALVLRSAGTANRIVLGSGPAVSKLGFTPGATSYGNFNRIDHLPEDYLDITEAGHLKAEISDLDYLATAGALNKLDRTGSTSMPYVEDAYYHIGKELDIVNLEIPKITTEVNATGVILQESSITPSYGQNLIAYNNAVVALNNAYIAQAYDNSIITDWEGKGENWRWVLDYTDSTQIIRGKRTSDNVGVDQSSGPGIELISDQTSFILEVPNYNDIRFLNAYAGDSSRYPKLFYISSGGRIDGSWTGWSPSVDSSYSSNNQITFHFEGKNLFTIRRDPGFTAPTYTNTGTLFRLNWNETGGSETRNFSFGSYPKVSNLISAINAVDGFEAYSNYPNYDYTNLSLAGPIVIPVFPGVTVFSGTSSPAFSMYYDTTVADAAAVYKTDSTALAISRYYDGTFIGKNQFLYSVYSTLNYLQNSITAAIPTVKVVSNFNPSHNYGTLQATDGTMSKTSPGNHLHLVSAPLFNVFFDMANLRYSTDVTALNIYWEEYTNTIQKQYLYAGYPLVSNMKAALNNITGILAAGSGVHDSSYCTTFLRTAGALDATIYSSMHDCSAVYQTISDRILDVRNLFATDRSDYLTERIDYLDSIREYEIREQVDAEDILLTNTGSNKGNIGDLYIWANNRFNRRQGCYAKLKQIEQQIASNKTALQINRILLT